MANQDMRHIKSGGRRLGLYAELGRYFTPDGRLNEPEFRQFLRESLAGREDADRWLSEHLEAVFTYLEERGLDAASRSLFQAAADESEALGMGSVALPLARLRRLMDLPQELGEETTGRKRDPDDKRRKIFDAALQVFTEHGFHESTMDEIAAASGVAKGTVYRYFASKEDLLDHLLKSTSRRIAERFAGAFVSGGDVVDQIRVFIEQWVFFIEENQSLYRLIQTEGLNGPASRQTMFYEYLIADFPMVKERVAAMDTGGALKTVSFHTVAYGMLGFIDGVARKWFRSGMEYPLRDELPVILEVMFNGFLGDGARRQTYFIPPETGQK
jgi:AcrR family transcriptional regulator